MPKRRLSSGRLALFLVVAAASVGFMVVRIESKLADVHTVEGRVEQLGCTVEARLASDFKRAGVPYPPARLVLAGFKEEKRLELYAAASEGPLRFIRAYPVLAASGTLGPKLREGDRQVPEGVYGVEYLNPNSAYHLSMKVTYPNAFDRARAKEEGRTNPGGDIMIHGGEVSIGCLAMGDEAAEDLFVLAAHTGVKNVTVILSPIDFRVREMPPLPEFATPLPAWTKTLYPEIRAALSKLPSPKP